jgi:citrate lyase subunit gamma (acyl carrier protein)
LVGTIHVVLNRRPNNFLRPPHFSGSSKDRIPTLAKSEEERVVMPPKTAKILREAQAGLQDKGDVVVRLKPGDAQSGIRLDIESKVMSMFGDQIRASVLEMIDRYGLTDVHVSVRDQGALDYAIRARVQAAIERAIKED